jgi:hypothetical protein
LSALAVSKSQSRFSLATLKLWGIDSLASFYLTSSPDTKIVEGAGVFFLASRWFPALFPLTTHADIDTVLQDQKSIAQQLALYEHHLKMCCVLFS